ncbi:hypothetical protein [Fodinicola feengrottensis]|uniref:hypothetical protein n=1 Tax=Fodinicola feengrottensis TaxID=435914 RepID=UPI0013D0A125|nr:hypothetical protein [Fodinicola feengrottensis]
MEAKYEVIPPIAVTPSQPAAGHQNPPSFPVANALSVISANITTATSSPAAPPSVSAAATKSRPRSGRAYGQNRRSNGRTAALGELAI